MICGDDQLHAAITNNADAVYKELSECCLDFDSDQHTKEEMAQILQSVYELAEHFYPIEVASPRKHLAQKMNSIFEKALPLPLEPNTTCEDAGQPRESVTGQEKFSDMNELVEVMPPPKYPE